MKVTTTVKFGQFHVKVSKEITGEADTTKYLGMGLLQEAQRSPATKAEKGFWKDGEGKAVDKRPVNFNRGSDIPFSDANAKAIGQAFKDAGYEVEVSQAPEAKAGEPAWKTKVKAWVALRAMGDDFMSEETLLKAIAKLSKETGVEVSDMLEYAGIGVDEEKA